MDELIEEPGLTPEQEQALVIMQIDEVAQLRARRDEMERLEKIARPDAVLKLIEEEDDQERDLKLRIDSDEKKRIVQQLDKLLEKAKKDMADDVAEWDLIDAAYNAKIQPRPYSWQANLCVPVVQVKCDKVKGAIVGELSSANPIMPLEPQEASDVPRVKLVEKYIHAKAIKTMDLITELDYVADEATRYGIAYMECPWVEETESTTEVMEFDGLDPEDMKKFSEMFPQAGSENPEIVNLLKKGAKIRFSVEDKKETYRGPKPKYVPARDVRQPKGYNDPHKMPFQFRMFKASWAELEKGVEDEKYEQEALDRIRTEWAKKQEKMETQDVEGYIEKEYEVYEGWWMYNTVGKVHERCIFTIVPEFLAYLRGMKYPFTHNRSYLIDFRVMEKPNSFYGYSIGSRARKIQYLMNMIINTAIDSDAANWPMYVHKTSSKGQNLDRQGYRPFKIWEVAQGDDLSPLASGSRTTNSLELYSVLQRIADDATRVSEAWTGAESKNDPNAPAAKTRMLLQVSQQGMIELLQTFLKGMTELTFQICELYSQYGTGDDEFRILNEDGTPSLEAAPDDMRVRQDMQPMGANPLFGGDAKKQNLLQLMTLMIQDPVVQALVTSDPEGSAAWLDNWQRLLEVWGGGLDKSAHDLIGPLKNIIQKQMMQAQMAQQMQAEQQQMQAAEQAVMEGQATPEEVMPPAMNPVGPMGGM